MDRVRQSIIFIVCFIFVTPTFASSVTYFAGPFQYDDTFQRTLLENGLYKRYDYPYFGGDLHIDAFSNGTQIRNPVNGETWTVAIEHVPSGRVLGSVTFVYDEPSDCIYYQGAQFACGLRIPDGETGLNQLTITLRFGTECLAAADHELLVDHILPASGGGPLPISDSPYAFLPTRFRPAPPVLGAPSELRPELPGDDYSDHYPLERIPAETGVIAVAVLDSLGCGAPVQNATLEVTGTIKEQSGGHTHFSDSEEPADGQLWPFEISSPPSDSGPRLTTTTDGSDPVLLKYQPGELASIEKFAFKATVPETDYEPEFSAESEHELAVKVPGLIHLPAGSDGQDFIYSYGGGCPHRVGGQSNTSTGTYFTGEMINRVVGLNALYNGVSGVNLSFNDATLPHGGFFENKDGSGRDSKCHGSHRRGIDVDVNGPHAYEDFEDGLNLRDPNYMLVSNGSAMQALSVLTLLANSVALEKIPEGYSIHYRRIPN